jgi:coenzyme F420-reducing hydrogenase delta subunit
MTTDQMVMLLSLLGGFFVPMNKWNVGPKTAEEKLQNVNTCIQLLTGLEIETERLKVGEIAQGDAKAIARLMYLG